MDPALAAVFIEAAVRFAYDAAPDEVFDLAVSGDDASGYVLSYSLYPRMSSQHESPTHLGAFGDAVSTLLAAIADHGGDNAALLAQGQSL
jgi:hypothetical protein